MEQGKDKKRHDRNYKKSITSINIPTILSKMEDGLKREETPRIRAKLK